MAQLWPLGLSMGIHIGLPICLPMGPPTGLGPLGFVGLFWAKKVRDLIS